LEVWLFTFGRVGAALTLCVAVTVVGCAAPTAPLQASAVDTVTLSGPSYATVDAVRPITQAIASGDSRAQILAAMGVPLQPGISASEVVLQTDDGRTLSVVQADPLHLVPGQRVRLVPGATPTLVPAAPAS
jgi:outer membrane lipoprotein SlyB